MSTTDNQLLVEIENTKQAEIASKTEKATIRAVVLGIVVIVLGCGQFMSSCELDKYDQSVVKLKACKAEVQALDRLMKTSRSTPNP